MRKNHGSSALFATKRYFCLRGTKLLWFDGPNGRMLGEADVGGASIEHPSPNSLKISYHNGRKDQLRVNTNNHGPTAKEWVLALRAVAVSTRIEAFSKSKRSSILTVLDHLSPPLIVNDHQHYKENDDDENRPPSRRVFTVLKRIKAKGKALERLAEIRDGYLYLFDLEERLKKKILLSHLVSVEQSKFVSQQLILRWGDRHKNFRLDFRTIGQAETFFYLLQAQNWNSGQAPGKSYSSRLGYDSSTKKQNGWLRIRICTWNVGNRAPSKNLGPWLRYPGAHVTDQELDDAIDTEESVKEEEEEEEIQKGKGFCRVAGVDSAQRELAEIVEYLQRPERFISIGARCPRGVLLTGPPGSGKTLLAAATAEEAGVPFFSCSAAAFVEILVGRGAARVRDLFIKARTHAPSIVFIDEIDAVARSRSASSFSGGGSDEREQTLNQILTELDGFDEKFISSSKQQYKGPVILIAATNRPEILDSALTRPGRLDRIVSVPLPDRKGREAILRVHIKSVKTEPSLDLSQLATACPANFSGADLACVVNEAALLALRSRADCVHAHHFKLAIQKRIQAHHLL
mmetsp:Transcript_11367/g.16991  ORF Transcript_11367/g.16991 Transcript_11367/m.16991 type:complete len:574 (+) Transcript_11367:268-1989(+)